MHIVSRNIADLYESPHQQNLFRNLSEAEFRRLVASMKSDGLRCPVEIRQSGEIIDGHQRVRAARQLQWEKIDVCVRADLDDAEDSAVQKLDFGALASPDLRAVRNPQIGCWSTCTSRRVAWNISSSLTFPSQRVRKRGGQQRTSAVPPKR